MEIEMGYIVAKGPEGLEAVLTEFLKTIETDLEFKAKSHYVLYEWGSQKSLIKVDMQKWPFQFWYCDLLGRSATTVVQDAVNHFLWEKCGEKERFLKEKKEDKGEDR